MIRLRVAAVALSAAAMLATTTLPGHAALNTAVTTERVVKAAFHIGEGASRADVTIEAIVTDTLGGAIGSVPSRTSSSTACITIDPVNTENPSHEFCGPAHTRVAPTLDMATVSATIQGVAFQLQFVATDPPSLILEPPTFTSSAVGASRAGNAAVSLVGDVFDSTVEGSSWYAEVREKAKTASSPS